MSDLTPIKTAIAVHKNVYTALAAAQLAMDPVKKGAMNPAFKGEGKPKGTAYADLADVVQAVRGALNENGLAFFHQILRLDGDQVMRTVLVHGDSETRIDCDVPLIVDRNNMQGMKSATTYAKRIGLESVTGVAPEDDDGNAASAAAPQKQEQRRSEPPRQEQKATEKPSSRDPKAVQQGLLASIAKMGTADAMDEQNSEGTKFAAAWQWLEDHHPDLSATVKATFDSRRQSLADAPSRGLTDDNIPY